MPDKEEIVCVTCKKKEPDQKNAVECVQCHKWEHIKCKSVSNKEIPKLRSKPYLCSSECQTVHEGTPRSPAVDAELLGKLNAVLHEVRETREEVASIKGTVAEIEKSQNFISAEFEKLLVDVASLKEGQQDLVKHVGDLQGKHQYVNSKIIDLELEVDRLTRAGLTKNMVILGLPATKDENVGDLVQKVAASIGYELPQDAIQDAKRMNSKEKNKTNSTAAPIKVVFSDEHYKEDLLAQKKAYKQLLPSAVDAKFASSKNRIVLRDEVTPYGMKLLSEVREAEYLADYKFIWPGRNGVVLVKKSEHSQVLAVRSIADLLKLKPHTLKRPLNVSTSSSTNSSPEIISSERARPKKQCQ